MPNITEQSRMIRNMTRPTLHKRPPGNTEGHEGEQRMVKSGNKGVRLYVRAGGEWWYVTLRTALKQYE